MIDLEALTNERTWYVLYVFFCVALIDHVFRHTRSVYAFFLYLYNNVSFLSVHFHWNRIGKLEAAFEFIFILLFIIYYLCVKVSLECWIIIFWRQFLRNGNHLLLFYFFCNMTEHRSMQKQSFIDLTTHSISMRDLQQILI